uniref:LIM and SH3 domain protein 1 (inferred by orthology to a human protein) n=1 Tax=Strongyloides venezuelensis TaxID=75913 RepID=A0A0K0F5Q1_STRVS
MSKKCAREECGKTVYPIEELKCLDKVWHKQCFKCTVCGMALNMKNYKGYNKMPYCEPHYPKTKATIVVDTPEMKRLADNTKLQSKVQYTADFEKMKGTKIEIVDDPELQRHLKNTQVVSKVAYQGELEKKKLMEEVRPQKEVDEKSDSGISNASQCISSTNEVFSYYTPYKGFQIYSSDQNNEVTQLRQVGSIADYDPLNGNWGSATNNNNNYKKQNGESIKNLTNALQQTSLASPTKVSNRSDSGVVSPTNTVSTPRFNSKQTGFTVKALYDYTAADNDEVSFLENDIIVNCQKVDDGWMTGTVQRTLQWGMLPANYVEMVKPVKRNIYIK